VAHLVGLLAPALQLDPLLHGHDSKANLQLSDDGNVVMASEAVDEVEVGPGEDVDVVARLSLLGVLPGEGR